MLPVVGPLMLQLQSNLLRQTFIFLSLSRLRTISRTSHIISSRGATTGKGRGHGPAMLNNPYKKGITKMAQQRESGFLSFFFLLSAKGFRSIRILIFAGLKFMNVSKYHRKQRQRLQLPMFV